MVLFGVLRHGADHARQRRRCASNNCDLGFVGALRHCSTVAKTLAPDADMLRLRTRRQKCCAPCRVAKLLARISRSTICALGNSMTSRPFCCSAPRCSRRAAAACSAFVAGPPGIAPPRRAAAMCAEIASPFDADAASSVRPPPPPAAGGLELTVANVDTVLDEVRHHLVADGGNVAVVGVDEATRSVRLQRSRSACGSCPSSTVTMKMGIERVLNENFADLGEVVAVDPGPEAERVDLAGRRRRGARRSCRRSSASAARSR